MAESVTELRYIGPTWAWQILDLDTWEKIEGGYSRSYELAQMHALDAARRYRHQDWTTIVEAQ